MRVSKKNCFHIKPVVALLAVGLFSGKAVAASPFATLPLHLQHGSTTTTAGGVRPNVLLQIDDSGSMNAGMSGVYPGNPGFVGPTRMQVVRTALTGLLNNPEFRDAVNWNMITLCNTDRFWPSGYRDRDPSWRFAVSPAELQRRINLLRPNCATPSTERYLDALHILRSTYDSPDAYRCQKNYVVLFSDGGANGYRVRMDGDSVNGFYPAADNDNENLNRNGALIRIGNTSGPPVAVWWAKGSRFKYLHRDPAKFASYQNGINFNITDGATRQRLGSSQLLLLQGGRYVWNQRVNSANGSNGGWGNSIWVNDGRSIQYFAEYVYDTDLKRGGTDAAGKSWDDPTLGPDGKTPLGRQTIGTFTIGFGQGIAANERTYLSLGATANNGQFIPANNQQQLDAAFKKIFDQINLENLNAPPASYSSVSPSLPSEDTTTGIPNMAAAMHLDLQKGSSEIRFYDVSTSAKNTTTIGSTYKTPDFSSRRVIIGPSATQSATWMDSLAVNNAYFDIPSLTTNQNEWKNSLIPWLTRNGSDSAANRSGNALEYRVRDAASRQMGDVVNAPILSYGAETNGRQKYLITAANDGMVYLFQSSNNVNHPYALKLNYLPGFMPRETADDTLVRNLKHLADPKYITDASKPHLYMVDGGITIRSTDRNGPEQIFMVGNLGRGGRGTYAINIGGHKRSNASQTVGIDAPESTWTTSVPLFETPKGVAADEIGYGIGSPTVGRISPDRSLASGGVMTTNLYDVKYAAFVGSGVKSVANPTASESALYVYNIFGGDNVGLQVSSGNQPVNNAQSGELLRKIPVGGTGGLMEPTIVDVNFDGVVDIAYAADYNGGLYRFDFRNGAPNTWTAHKIFQTRNNRPITSAPAIVRQAENKYIVIFGTGSDLYQADLSNTDTQSVYGIYDDVAVANPSQVMATDLLEQTISSTTVAGNPARVLSDRQIGSAHKGWFFDLPAGERVVIKPSILLKTVLLSTRSYSVNTTGSATPPSNDPCIGTSQSVQSKGESWVMQFRSDTGGVLPGSSSRDPDRDLFAYVDFFKQNANNVQGARVQNMVSGAQLGSALTTFAANNVYNSKGDAAGGKESAVSGHGDSSAKSGRDMPLKSLNPLDKNIPDLCFASENAKLFVTDSEKGFQDTLNIYGRICSTQLRRISWREIF